MKTNSSLISLKLSNMLFDDDGCCHDDDDDDRAYRLWRSVLVENATLRRLDLSGSCLGRRSAEALSGALLLNSEATSSLRSLDLARCSLSDESLSEVVRSVRDHANLANLNLS